MLVTVIDGAIDRILSQQGYRQTIGISLIYRRVPPHRHPSLSNSRHVRIIHLQRPNRRPTTGSYPKNLNPIIRPSKMFLPNLRSRIE